MSFLKTTAIQHLNGSSPAISFDAGGNVAIGTTVTSGIKLYVGGRTKIGDGVLQGTPDSSDIGANSHVMLGGYGGNFLSVGQFANGSQWIQSSYYIPSTAKYNLVLQPLGGYVTMPNQPLFSGSDSRALDLTDVQLNSSNCYDTVTYNVGGHFNASTGRFTCPVTGYYEMSFHGQQSDDPATNINVRLRKNEVSNDGPLAEAWNQGGRGATNVYVRSLIQCNAGDYLDYQVARLKTLGGVQHKRFLIRLIG